MVSNQGPRVRPVMNDFDLALQKLKINQLAEDTRMGGKFTPMGSEKADAEAQTFASDRMKMRTMSRFRYVFRGVLPCGSLGFSGVRVAGLFLRFVQASERQTDLVGKTILRIEGSGSHPSKTAKSGAARAAGRLCRGVELPHSSQNRA